MLICIVRDNFDISKHIIIFDISVYTNVLMLCSLCSGLFSLEFYSSYVRKILILISIRCISGLPSQRSAPSRTPTGHHWQQNAWRMRSNHGDRQCIHFYLLSPWLQKVLLLQTCSAHSRELGNFLPLSLSLSFFLLSLFLSSLSLPLSIIFVSYCDCIPHSLPFLWLVASIAVCVCVCVCVCECVCVFGG